MSSKIEPCPFCGLKCEFDGDDWTAYTCSDFANKCTYAGPASGTEEEAIAAHNKVARAVRLMPEAVELLAAIDMGTYFGKFGAMVPISKEEEWASGVQAFLTEAREQQPEEGEK